MMPTPRRPNVPTDPEQKAAGIAGKGMASNGVSVRRSGQRLTFEVSDPESGVPLGWEVVVSRRPESFIPRQDRTQGSSDISLADDKARMGAAVGQVNVVKIEEGPYLAINRKREALTARYVFTLDPELVLDLFPEGKLLV